MGALGPVNLGFTLKIKLSSTALVRASISLARILTPDQPLGLGTA